LNPGSCKTPLWRCALRWARPRAGDSDNGGGGQAHRPRPRVANRGKGQRALRLATWRTRSGRRRRFSEPPQAPTAGKAPTRASSSILRLHTAPCLVSDKPAGGPDPESGCMRVLKNDASPMSPLPCATVEHIRHSKTSLRTEACAAGLGGHDACAALTAEPWGRGAVRLLAWPPARVVHCTSSARGRAVPHGSTPSTTYSLPAHCDLLHGGHVPCEHTQARSLPAPVGLVRYSSLLPSTILLYGVSSLRPIRTQHRDESAAAAPEDERSARNAVRGTQCEASLLAGHRISARPAQMRASPGADAGSVSAAAPRSSRPTTSTG
jgi:hypothetical protein